MRYKYLTVLSGFLIENLMLVFGWNSGHFKYLLLFMITDYITGLMVAAVNKNSAKTESGRLSSEIAYRGIAKKLSMICMVAIGYSCDNILNIQNFLIRETVIMSFIINELLSVTENVGLMGVPIPNIIKNAIEILRQKEEDNENI